ncbi:MULTISPECIES: hypothetical protein [Streptomyces]|uniref:hypothetical protein n=1 Tax=Streptomyces TaxID=1883 RepID=UPI0004CCD6DA|nr:MULTISPECIES: hypothetical protein [Streptomyces]KOT47267.1 hypothetical protein ADK43_39945 [Streptomyces rimosus subsp. rimosus]
MSVTSRSRSRRAMPPGAARPAPDTLARPLPAPRHPGRTRVAVAALKRQPRFAACAAQAAERLAALDGIDLLGGPAPTEMTAGEVPAVLTADVDVLFAAGHSYDSRWINGSTPDSFVGVELADLDGPLRAPVLVAYTCSGASRRFRASLAALRPADLPPLTLLACDGNAPYTHEPLFAPLLKTLLTHGQPARPWPERLRAALSATLASDEVPYRRWERWGVYIVPGTAAPSRPRSSARQEP